MNPAKSYSHLFSPLGGDAADNYRSPGQITFLRAPHVPLETTAEAQQAYRALIADKSKGTVWLAGGCASWYLDKHGHNSTLWPDFTFRFRKMLSAFDRENYVGVPAERDLEVAA